MLGIALAGEFAGQVRITLPVADIRGINRPVPAGRKATVREPISKNVSHWVFRFGTASEVSALVDGVAPGTVRVPVPGSHSQFRVISVGDRPPSRRERLLKDVRRIDFVDASMGENID